MTGAALPGPAAADAGDALDAAPPRAAERLLRLALPRGAFGDAVVGDLAEAWCARRGRRATAAAWYWREALGIAGRFVAHRVATAVMTTPLQRRPAAAAAGVALLGAALLVAALVAGAADALVLRPVRGVARPRALLTSDGVVSARAFRRLRATTPAATAEVAAFGARELPLAVGGRVAPSVAVLVSGNYFAALGAPVAHGRALGGADDRADAPLAAVVSADLFDRLLGGDTTRLGATIRVGGARARVVGVASRSLRAPDAAGADLWLPLAAWPRVRPAWGAGLDLDAPGWGWLRLLARPAAGRTVAEARAELAARSAAIARDRELRAGIPETLAFRAPRRADGVPEPAWPLALGGAAAAALAAAGVLQCRRLTRGAGARLEPLVDAALLAAPAGALALVGAAAARAVAPEALAEAIAPAWTAGAVAALAALAALGIWGAAPRGAAADGRGARALARAVAAGLALVGGAALLTAARTARGPAPRHPAAAAAREDGVQVATVNLGLLGYEPAEAEAFVRRASGRLRGAAALRGFAWTTTDPSEPGGGDRESFAIDGQPVRGRYLSPRLVSDGYGAAMRVRLLRGRDAAGPDEVVVNVAAARFWAGADPIGGRLTILDVTATVVGMIDEPGPAGPRVYGRLGVPWTGGAAQGALLRPVTLLLVPAGDAAAALDAARRAVDAADGRATLVWRGALADRLERGGSARRAAVAWSLALAAVAALAAASLLVGDAAARRGRGPGAGARRPPRRLAALG